MNHWKVTAYTGKNRDKVLGHSWVKAHSETQAVELGRRALRLIGVRGRFQVSASWEVHTIRGSVFGVATDRGTCVGVGSSPSSAINYRRSQQLSKPDSMSGEHPDNAEDQQARTNEPRSGQMMLRALLHPLVIGVF